MMVYTVWWYGGRTPLVSELVGLNWSARTIGAPINPSDARSDKRREGERGVQK
jgi:hypothetical protein